MKKPTKWSRWGRLKRRYRMNHRTRPSYLYVFPADREKGWLCAGNGYWGKEINEWNEHLRKAEERAWQGLGRVELGEVCPRPLDEH